jgi:NADH-quinone oxidoreductase subunit C/D
VFYHLMSIERNSDVMIKVALSESDLSLPTVTGIWPNANWYEREVWDMFGIDFTGHPHLTRIMMPPTWEGHPLRKDFPARATEFDPYSLTLAKQQLEEEAARFKPEDWGMKRSGPTRTTCSSTSARTTLRPTVPSASSCSWTAKKSSTACRTSVTTTVAPRRWPSVSPGTASSRTPTVSTTSAA